MSAGLVLTSLGAFALGYLTARLQARRTRLAAARARWNAGRYH